MLIKRKGSKQSLDPLDCRLCGVKVVYNHANNIRLELT